MKKICIAVMLFTMVISMNSILAQETIKASDNLAKTARSYVLMEAKSGQILLEKNKEEVYPPASITKVMTILLAYEAIDAGKIQWDDMVTVSEHAASMGGSQIFMEAGEKQTVRDLVKAISIASANDAAVAMAEYIGGSEAQFVDLMNKRAKELGMENTVFKNACGLHIDGHVSTAEDIAIMSRELITKYPEISKTATTWMDTITHRTRKGESEFGLTNTNKMIKWYNGVTGLKTGYTPEAKHCVSATASRDNVDLIAVIMGAQDGKIRFKEASELLDYGFANFSIQKGPQVGEVLAQTKVVKGDANSVDLTIENSMTFVVPKSSDIKELTYTIKCEDSIKAPVYRGQKIGVVTYKLNEEEVGEADLVASKDVGKARMKNMINYTFHKFFKTTP
ncbi:MAG: D-alanyl-D-alanine carboxypeptidase family protein [Cellulosilyticaceae bacterium]